MQIGRVPIAIMRPVPQRAVAATDISPTGPMGLRLEADGDVVELLFGEVIAGVLYVVEDAAVDPDGIGV